jgi:PAS domain S-box-containing protein
VSTPARRTRDDGAVSTAPEPLAPLAADEREMAAALAQLAEAVTVQRPDGRVTYANEAALRLLGFASLQEILDADPAALAERSLAVHPDGSELLADELPGRRVLLGEEPEPLLLRWIAAETGEPRWSLVKATALRDEAGRIVAAVNVIEDVTQVREAELAQRLLAQAGEELASSLDYEETLQRVARLAVPELADWCGVDVLDARGVPQQVALAHVDPERVAVARELRARYPPDLRREEGIGGVLRTGRTQLFGDVTDELLAGAARDPDHLELLRRIGLSSVLIVPLVYAGRVIGTLSLVLSGRHRRFTAGDVALAEELGRRAGAAVHQARLFTERGRIAHVLQASLVPSALPPVPGWEMATLFRAAGEANEVGGDFYDVEPLDDGALAMVGDVTGKGETAAALTPQVRHTLSTAVALTGDLASGLAHLNRALLREPVGTFCSVAAALLAGGRVRLAVAGHPPPVLVRPGEPPVVLEAEGPLLGAREDAAWPVEELALAPGEALVLYTDGVTDAVGEAGRFGRERLLAALEGPDTAAEALVARLADALAAFERAPQRDDIAVLALTRRGDAPA